MFRLPLNLSLRRAAVGAAIIPVVFASLPVGLAVAQAPDADERLTPVSTQATPGLQATAEARTPLRSGAVGIVAGALFHSNQESVPAPVTVSFDGLPDGVQPIRLDATAGSPDGVAWECDSTSSDCTLVSTGASNPVGLAAGELAPWRLVLDVSDDAQVADGASLTLSASAGDEDAADFVQSAPSTIELYAGAEVDTLVTFDSPTSLTAGGTISTTVSLLNLVDDDAPAAFTITGLFPAVISSWTVPSDDWVCVDDAAATPTCTWSGEAPAIGEEFSPLVATAVVDAAFDDDDVAWTSNVVSAGRPAISEDHVASVPPPPAPSSTLSASVAGEVAVVAPADVVLDVDITALAAVAGPIEVSAALPQGITVDVDASTAPWKCTIASSVATCELDVSDLERVDDLVQTSTLALPLSIGVDAALGVATIDLTVAVPGEPATHLGDNATSVAFAISEAERALFEVLPSLVLDDGSVEVIVDGGFPMIRVGEQIALTPHNRGSASVEAGTDVELVFTTARSVDIDWRDDNWTCESALIGAEPFTLGVRSQCTATADTAVRPDGRLPALIGDVVEVRGDQQAGEWPTSIEVIDVAGAGYDDSMLASSVTVDVERTAAELSLAAEPMRLRDGGFGTLEFLIENLGDAPAADVAVIVSLGSELHLADAAETCRVHRLVENGPLSNIADSTIVECSLPGAVPADGSTRLLVNVTAAGDAIDERNATAVLRSPDIDGSEPISVAVDVREPLAAVAQAVPDIARPTDEMITLDGRFSEGGAAIYTWRQLPADGDDDIQQLVTWVGSDTPTGRVVQFERPDVDGNATLRFELTITDGAESATDVVEVSLTDRTETPTPETTVNPVIDPVVTGQGNAVADLDTNTESAADEETLVRGVSESVSMIDGDIDVANGIYGAFERNNYVFTSFQISGPIAVYDPDDVASSSDLPYAVEGTRIDKFFDPVWSQGTTEFLGFFRCGSGGSCVDDGVGADLGATFNGDPILSYFVPSGLPAGSVIEARFESRNGSNDLIGDFTSRVAVLPRVPFAADAPSVTGAATELGHVRTMNPGVWYFGPTAYSYRWQRCTDQTDASTCSDVSGATTDEYEPTASDAGKFLRVAVSASNALGSSIARHDLVSDAVPAFDMPVIELSPSAITSPVEGQATSVVLGDYAPAGVTATAHQWFLCSETGSSCAPISTATGSTYTPTESDAGRHIRADVTVTASGGSITVSTPTRLVAGATVLNTAPPMLVGPASATDQQRYTATSGSWAFTNSSTTTTYEFRRCSTISTAISTCPVVQAAGSSSAYDLVAADIGTHLAVIVTRQNPFSPAVDPSSRTATPVAAPAPVATATPTINGPAATAGAKVGVTSSGEWDWDGSSYDVQWQRCTGAGTGCNDLGGATETTYDLTRSDDGSYIHAVITTTNEWGESATSTSNAVGPVSVVVPTSLAAPSIALSTGAPAPHEGMQLTAVAGTWTSPPTDPLVSARTYEWQRCDGGGCTTIATGPTYTLANADVGNAMLLVERVATGLGVTSTAESAQSSTVSDGAPRLDTTPVLSTSPLVAQQLSVNTGTWFTWTGATPTFSYQWQSCTVDLTACADRSSTSTYTPSTADLGRRLSVTIDASNEYGTSTTVTDASDPVALGSGPSVSTDAPGGALAAIGGDDIVIIGSASGTGTLTSTWTQISGTTVLSEPIDGNELSFTAPNGITETLTFVYRATQPDEQFSEAVVDVSIVVDAEVTVAGPTEPLVGGEPASLTAVGVGPEPRTFLWTQLAGPDVLSGTPTGPRLDFTPPATGTDTLQFRVEMVTADGQTAAAVVDVGYTPPAVASTDLAGNYASIAGGETVTVTGAGSGTGSVSLVWTQVAGDAVLTDPVDGAVLSITSPATGIGSLTFRLTVTASDGRTDSIDIDIDYAQPVGIDIVAPTDTVTGGAEITLDARATGIAPFSYEWTQVGGPDVEIDDNTVDDLSVAAPTTGEGTLEFSVTITTDDDQTDTATVTVDYTQPAVITSATTSDASVLTGTTVRLTGAGTALAPATSNWTQTGGTTVLADASTGDSVDVTVPSTGNGTLVFAYTVTGANGRTDSLSVVVSYEEPPPTPAPVGLCDVVAAARVPGTSASLGNDIDVSFAAVAVSSRACTGDTTATFTGASITLNGVFVITGAAGSLDRSGLRLTSGTLSVDDDSFGDLRFDLVGDGLSITFGGDTFEATATFVSPGLALLKVPAGWTAATRIDFDATDDEGSVSIDAVAFPSSTTARSTDAGLPVIADSDAALLLGGTWSTGGAISLAARVQGFVDIGNGPVTLTGAVQRASSDAALSTQISAAIPGTIDVADGVELSNLNVEWNSGAITGTGTVTIADSASMRVSISFTNTTTWSVAIAGDSSAPSWEFVPGLTIDPARTSGAISRSGDTTTVQIDLGADTWNIVSGVTVDDLDLGATVTCTTGQSCTPSFSIRAGVTIDLGGVSLGGIVAGDIDLATGAFDLSVSSLTPFRPFDGVSVTDVSASVSRGANGDISVSLDGTATIGGTTGRLVLDLDARGWATQITVDDLTPFTGAPTFTDTTVLYASAARTLVIDGESIDLAARTVTVVGSTAPPAWLTDLLGLPSTQVDVRGSIDLSNQDVDLTVRLASLGGATLFDAAGVAISVDELDVTLRGRGSNISSDVTASAELRLPGIAGSSPTTVDVIVSAGMDPTAGKLNVSASLAPGERWNDVLGLSGLDVIGLAVSVEVSLNGGGAPMLGLAGTATLPSFIADPLGITAGTPVTLAARIGGAVDCFAFEIGDGSREAIDVLNAGVIVADSASLVIAPDGCRIGTYDYPAGISVGFDGEVLSVPAVVSIGVQPRSSSMSADIELGRVGLGGLAIEDVQVDLDVSPTSQRIEFSGGVTAFGASARAEGEVVRSLTGTRTRFAGTFAAPSLGGFGLDDLVIEFETSPGSGDISASGTTAIDLLGSTIDVDLDFALRNGQITRGNGTAQFDVDLAAISLDGDVEVEFVTGQFPKIDVDGSLQALGIDLAEATGSVGPSGMSLRARLGIDGLVDAQLVGMIAYSFSPDAAPALDGRGTVQVDPGDFRLMARGAVIGIAGFDLSSAIELSSIQGVTRASIDGSIFLGLGGASALVTLSGELDTAGGLDLAGTGSVRVAGYDLNDASFLATRNPDGTGGLSITGGFDLPGVGQIELGGSFERTAEYGTLFQMFGRANVEIGGFELADGGFVLFREASTGASLSNAAAARDRVAQRRPLIDGACTTASCTVSAGLVGTAQFSAPSVGSISVVVMAAADGSMSFDARTRLGGAAGSAIGSPTVTLRFEAPATGPAVLTFNALTDGAFGLPARFSVAGTISSDGRYSFAGAGSISLTSPTIDIGFARFRAAADGSFEVRASGSGAGAPRLEGFVTVNAEVQEKHVKFNLRWSGWSRIFGVRVSSGFSPVELKVYIDVAGFGTVTLPLPI